MKNKAIEFIEKHLTKIVGAIILWIIFSPIILTQFSIISFSNDGSTGQIGDTIGGITAPSIGLLSAILLYLALRKQIEHNNFIIYESNFKIIFDEIGEFKKTIREYQFYDESGAKAVEKFPEQISAILSSGETEGLYSSLNSFNNLIAHFDRLFYLIDNLKTSDNYLDFLKKEIGQTYNEYFNAALQNISNNWNVTEADLVLNQFRGKMYLIESNLTKISKVLHEKYNN